MAIFCRPWAVEKELDVAAQVLQDMRLPTRCALPCSAGANCIAVIPDLTKAALIVHGGGAVSCRTASGPVRLAFITMSCGSMGWQAGAERQDMILLMNQ